MSNERVSATLDRAAGKAEETWGKAKDAAQQVSDVASQNFDRVSRSAQDAYRYGRDATVKWEHSFEDEVKAHPLAAVLIAAGVGFILSRMWR